MSDDRGHRAPGPDSDSDEATIDDLLNGDDRTRRGAGAGDAGTAASGTAGTGTGSAAADLETSDAARPASSRRRRTLAAAVAVGVVAAVAVAVTVAVTRQAPDDSAEAVAVTVPVALQADGVPDGTTIGVVLTLGGGEGSPWAGAVQGARVAERRLALGGTDITLVTQPDGGTEDGARAAVEALVEQGAAGIVVGTSGPHVAGAVSAAADAGVPVVLPYASDDDVSSTAGAWSTWADADQVGGALTAALGDARRVLLVDVGGGTPEDVTVAETLDARGLDDATAGDLAEQVARLTGGGPLVADSDPEAVPTPPVADPADAVLVSGPATRQAAAVAVLQSGDLQVPVVLTPDATSPAFAEALRTVGASPSGALATVGPDAGDAVALRSDAAGRSMSAFLGGIRVLAEDGDAVNLIGDQPFSAVAGVADARSHDAVLALVRAVAATDGDAPSDVAAALGTLTLGPGDGIAGPPLDFTGTATTASAADFVTLHPSAQGLGLRPEGTDGVTGLTWFAAPGSD